MCGLVGVVGPPAENTTEEALLRALASVGHRGPDVMRTERHPCAAVGHSRLRIRDVRAEADQPFYSRDRTILTLFNGEVYNFRSLRSELIARHNVVFETDCDTEVVARGFEEWG